MFVVSMIGQKGGSGKTTTGLGLAVAAARAVRTVAVIDLDPQTNAANWKDRRSEENPAVVSAQSGRLPQTIEAARKAGADFVIIDTPGKADQIAIDAARVANLVLIPCRLQVFELETLPATRDLLRVAGDPPAYVVLVGIHPAATKSLQEARQMVERLSGLQTCPAHLCHRASYIDAPATGKAPQEIDPDGKAAAELERLYMFFCKHANM